MPDTPPVILDVKMLFNGKEYPMRQLADLDKMKEVLSVLERVFELVGGNGGASPSPTFSYEREKVQTLHEHQIRPIC